MLFADKTAVFATATATATARTTTTALTTTNHTLFDQVVATLWMR